MENTSSIHIFVFTYVNRDNLSLPDVEIDSYPVCHIDGHTIIIREFSFEFMQPQGRMAGIELQ